MTTVEVVADANTEKYAAAVEHAQNTTRGTFASQTQLAHTFLKCFGKHMHAVRG